MFLHAVLDRLLTQMGQSYSSTKPALPTLNISKVSIVDVYFSLLPRFERQKALLSIARAVVKETAAAALKPGLAGQAIMPCLTWSAW